MDVVGRRHAVMIRRLAAILGTRIKFLFADASASFFQRQAESSGGSGAGAQLIWYQVGDGSGRGGEVWKLETPGVTEKIGDWLIPNSRSGDIYINFSNLVGDPPSGDLFNTWHKLGGSSSANRSQGLGVSPPITESCAFDVELGTDGVAARDGPFTWQVTADAS